eukprot:jgi/Ulvmu1/3958/UM018_0181.1
MVCVQVAENLPEHLLTQLLGAAMATFPPVLVSSPLRLLLPKNNCGRLECLPPSNAQHAACALLPPLPDSFKPLAFQTLDSAGMSRGACGITLSDISTAPTITCALASGYAALLTSLSLVCLRQWQGPVWGNPARSGMHRQRAREVLAPLAALTELAQLHFAVVDENRIKDGAGPANLPTALACVLRRLTKLTHLAISIESVHGGCISSIAPRLTALCMLRHLDLGGCISQHALHWCKGSGPLHKLAHALPALTGLTHLGLSHNRLRNSGWAVLSPAVSALPLQSLDVSSCTLHFSWDLLGAKEQPLPVVTPAQHAAPQLSMPVEHVAAQRSLPAAAAQPFATLRSLACSGNYILQFGDFTLLRRVPQLTRIELQGVACSLASKVLQALGTTACAPLGVLSVSLCEADCCEAADVVRRCLQRCVQLRSVALTLGGRNRSEEGSAGGCWQQQAAAWPA